MTRTEFDDAAWIIVGSEDELAGTTTGFLPAAFETGALLDEERNEVRSLDCLTGVVTSIRRQDPVALLISKDRLLQVRIPTVGLVETHWRDAAKRLRFGIAGSPAVFTSSREQEDVVTGAFEAKSRLVVLDPSFDGHPVLVRRSILPGLPKFCDRFAVDTTTLSVLTKNTANEHYLEVFALNSPPPYTEGVPFRWSYSDCDAKAQSVRNVLQENLLTVGKVWAFAQQEQVLRVKTTSRKSCQEEWGFHVAVIVQSSEPDTGGFWVFDPTLNLENGVLSLNDWKTRLGPGLGPVHFSTADAYRHCSGNVDPRMQAERLGEHAEDLKIARCRMAKLAAIEGDPPHQCDRR